MPELPTLTITAADGTVRDTLTGIRAERDRHVTDRSRARFVLDAARWQTVADSINRRADRFRIDAAGETGWFGGRFRDTERGGQEVTVILDDYERDARDAEPTGGQVLFQNVDDATVVQDAISRIPTLSAGTIQTVASGLSFSFSNAEPAKMIRDAAQPGGALVRYNADRTVDFVARPRGRASVEGDQTEAIDVTGQEEITIRGRGATGGDSLTASGGGAEDVTATLDVSEIDTVTLRGADRGADATGAAGATGGLGYRDGGDGGNGFEGGGGGAGAAAVIVDGSPWIIFDGGGGAGDAGDAGGGGGGGARGGVGGDAGSTSAEAGADAEGTGTGGDGGDGGAADPSGEAGSYEVINTNRVTVVNEAARVTTGDAIVAWIDLPQLSTAANTLVGDPDVSDDNRNPPTEIIGLGAQSGPNQVRATATVDATAARDVYRRYENKDIQQQDRLQTTVDRLADEVAAAEDKLDVEADAINLDVRPGDPLAFVWPARGIDETVRVIEFTEVVGQRGQRYAPLRVSNRWPEQGGSDKAIADLERFNRGYQGFIDRDNFRAVERQPVDGSLAATGEYPYPDDVVTEVTSEITVRSLPYRSYVSSGGHSHSFSIGNHNHSVSFTTSSDEVPNSQATEVYDKNGLDNLSQQNGLVQVDGVSITESGWPYFISGVAAIADGDSASLNKIELVIGVDFDGDGIADLTRTLTNNPSADETTPDTNARNTEIINGGRLFSTDLSGAFEIGLYIRVLGSDSVDIVWDYRIDSIPTHTHSVSSTETTSDGGATSSTTDAQTALEPGVVESFPDDPGANANGELLASNVDIVINGSTVATDIGSGEFTQTVDISGALSPGVNDIEITSDTLGLVSAYVQTELFRQGPEDTV